jgi:hypothetical protein
MSPHLRVFKRSLATLHCGEKNIPRDLLQRNIHGGARTLVDPALNSFDCPPLSLPCARAPAPAGDGKGGD